MSQSRSCNVNPGLVELELADPVVVNIGLEYLHSFVTPSKELLNPGSQLGAPASKLHYVGPSPTTHIPDFLVPSQHNLHVGG